MQVTGDIGLSPLCRHRRSPKGLLSSWGLHAVLRGELLQSRTHGGDRALEVGVCARTLRLFRQPLRSLAQRPDDVDQDHVRVERLEHVAVGAIARRGFGGLGRRDGGDHEHRQLGVGGMGMGKQ